MPTPLTYQKIQGASGLILVPIYNVGDLADSSFRVMTSKGLGAYELVALSPSLPIRVMTPTGPKSINTVVETTPPPNGDATILVVGDTFTKANSTTSLGTADTGQTWQKYDFRSAVYGISANQAYPAVVGWDYPAFIDTGISDNYDYSLRLAVVGSGNQIMWRIAGDLNYLIISGTNIRRVVSNVWTTIGTIPTLVNGDVVKIQVRGNVHTIFVNGVQRAQVTESAHATATKVGFSSNSTSSRWDDITVHRL